MFRRLLEAYRRHNRIHASIRELNQLSDRELSDIGVNRGDIEFIARSVQPQSRIDGETKHA